MPKRLMASKRHGGNRGFLMIFIRCLDGVLFDNWLLFARRRPVYMGQVCVILLLDQGIAATRLFFKADIVRLRSGLALQKKL